MKKKEVSFFQVTNLDDSNVSSIVTTKKLISFFDYVSDDIILKEHQDIQHMIKLIDTRGFVDWAQWTISDLKSKFDTGPGGHILVDGHRAAAEKIIKYI